jgi:hypothetical protein
LLSLLNRFVLKFGGDCESAAENSLMDVNKVISECD